MGLAHSPSVVTDGLVLYLDAGSLKSYAGTGNTWADLSGNGNHGTLVGSPTYSILNNGNFIFNGNNYVNLVTATQFGISEVHSPFSISLWFKTSATTERYLFDNYDGTSPNSAANISFRIDGGKIESHITTVGASANQYGSNYADNQWHNAVVTWRGSPQVESVYVDGLLLGTSAKNLSGSFETDSVFRLGSRPTGSGGSYSGSLAICMVYAKELNVEDVQANFYAIRGRFGL
jgi:hypothetical protein